MSIDALLILESWELDQWQLEPCKFDISACGICQQVAMNLYFFMVGCWTNNYLFIAFEFFDHRHRSGKAHWSKNADPEASVFAFR